MNRLTRPRQHRLLHRPDFTACYDAGRRFFSQHFMLFVKPHADTQMPWRVGFAVTKKIGIACVRNRVKRVFREFFRLHQHLMPCATDIILVPKRQFEARSITLPLVTPELCELLAQVRRSKKLSHEK